MKKIKFTLEFVCLADDLEIENYSLEELAHQIALEFKRDVGDEVLSVDCSAKFVLDKQ